MCGIAGIVDFKDPISTSTISLMCKTLNHRGPDYTNYWLNDNIALGHTRLSIIDLSPSGNQPMHGLSGKYHITYNGEIYNYRELKNQYLKDRSFKSASDTEVLLHLWEEKGVDSLNLLNGMFAFAIWNKDENILSLIRDPLGIKPLYYWYKDSKIVFASEIKAILESGIPKDINHEAIAEHFSFQNTFGDKTFFKDIHLLPQGHFITFSKKGFNCQKYYEIYFDEDGKGKKDINVLIDNLRDCLNNSINRQLVSDVPVGAYLSGGMDTGSIATVASKQIPNIHSFTCGFKLNNVSKEEKLFDERSDAKYISKLINTSHHELELDYDSMEKSIAKTVWHLDEPRMGISYQIINTSKLVSDYVKVVLSGVGGDELFAGYPWRYSYINNPNGSSIDYNGYLSAVRFFDDSQIHSLFTKEFNDEIKNYSSWESYKNVMKECNAKDPLNRALFYDIKTFLNGILIVDDKLSMANSVEARVPLLDKEIVELSLRIPSNYKLKENTGKYILRKAMEGLLPESILNKKKIGFTPPDQSWYKNHTMAYIQKVILSSDAKKRNIFNLNTINNIVNEHLQGVKNHRFLLWSLVCFECWYKLFFDKINIDI